MTFTNYKPQPLTVPPDLGAIAKAHRESRERLFWDCLQRIFDSVPPLEQLAAIQRVWAELGPPPSMERGPEHLRKLWAHWQQGPVTPTNP